MRPRTTRLPRLALFDFIGFFANGLKRQGVHMATFKNAALIVVIAEELFLTMQMVSNERSILVPAGALNRLPDSLGRTSRLDLLIPQFD